MIADSVELNTGKNVESTMKNKIYGCLAAGLIGDAMGAPVENWNYWDIESKYKTVDDFEGEGTDDSAVKLVLCEALIDNNGYITADEFAQSFLNNEKKCYNLLFIPVRNMFHKVKDGISNPIDAGLGNMQSSSSAMAIAPMGLVNACNPRQAAVETFDVAGLIHSGSTSFCRDAACAVAAAVAEAMSPVSDVDSILHAATTYLHPVSSAIMRDAIIEAIGKAKELGSYEEFRSWIYANRLRDVICDSRETVPVTFALFYLANGDVNKVIIYAANFGRDSDTIATMAGAIAGAYQGAAAIRRDWLDKIEKNSNQHTLTDRLYQVISHRISEDKKRIESCNSMMQ